MQRRKLAGELVGVTSLDPRSRPSQERGRGTFEVILLTAGELLGEIGFERLTTNLVCERAGLTPPALYRYFPNKYAILAELARRLMDAQDEIFLGWLDSDAARPGTLENALSTSIVLRKAIVKVTRAHAGGMWILRAIRAIPELHDVRSTSRDKVVSRHLEVLKSGNPDVSEERLLTAARLSEQVGYAVIEMLVEDPSLDEESVIRETCLMTCLYFGEVLSWGEGSEKPKAVPRRKSSFGKNIGRFTNREGRAMTKRTRP